MSDTIVLEVPSDLKHLLEPIKELFATVQKHARAARRGGKVAYEAVEQEIGDATAKVERASHQDLLAQMDVDAPRLMIRGKEHSRVGRNKATYYTMTGPVEVERSLYREVGRRNAKTVDIISLRTGAVGGGWLPETAQAIAHMVQQGTSREAEQTAKALRRLPYSRPSFERVAHEVGRLYLEHQADIEDELIQEMVIPKEAASLSVALDRVSLPMEEPASRPVGRPRNGAPKHPIARNFRMAYCGTITLHDEKGDSIHTIRYGCMPTGDAELLAQGMAADVHRLLERRSDLVVAMLADGSPEMWNLMAVLRRAGATLNEIVDFWHLIEKLHAAAAVICNDEEIAKATVRAWRKKLRRRSSAIAEILKELEASGCEFKRHGGEQPVHQAITYLRNNGHRMNYASALRKGLPIGSGNVEATCKTLVGQRMKRCGARWKPETGEHVLQLRALGLSDRFDDAMGKLFETQRTSVRRAA